MSLISFGQVIPVTGPNLGFPGTVSRQGERVVSARQFTPYTSSNTLAFGAPTVLVPSATGGVWTSVADAVAHAVANAGLVVTNFAGFAVREVQTMLAYPYGTDPGTQQVGYYANAQMADVLERGSATLLASVSNSPLAGGAVYTRILANAAITAGTVGDYEIGTPAASDLFTLTGVTGVAAGQTALTLTATGVYVGQVISGPGIVPGTYVVSGTGTPGSYSAIVLSQAITTALTSTSPLTFSNLVALPAVSLRTGVLDTNSVFEATIKLRNVA